MTRMGRILGFLLWLLSSGVISDGFSVNNSSRPAVVNVGAILTLDSTIGRVANIAIDQAVKDVNSDTTVLRGTKLVMTKQNTNCSGFLGMVEAIQFMETDVVAVIGPQSSMIAHAILNFADELQTPFLSFSATDPTLSSLQFPYFIKTTQSDLYQMNAVAEIVDHYGWKEVIVIFIDDEYGRNGISALDDTLAAKRCRITSKAGIPPGDFTHNDIMDILVKVALMESRVIIVHVYPPAGSVIFSVAHFLGMVDGGYVWIATDWLSSALDSSSPAFGSETLTSTMQGILVLRQHTPDSVRKKAFTARLTKLTGGSIGLNTYGLYAYDTVWVVARAIDSFFSQGGVISFSRNSKLQSLEKKNLHLEAMSVFDGGPLLLKNILSTNFIGLTGPVKISLDRSSVVFPAYEIINIVGTGLHRVGYWSNYSGLSIVAPEDLYSRPPNRSSSSQQLYPVVWPGESIRTPRGWVFSNNGKQLRIGVPRRVSYKEFVSQDHDTNTSKGFCIDVFTAAVNLLPYAVPYQFIPYGNGLENPSYNELVNLITTGFFDGVVGDIAIVKNRTRIVEFTQPYAASGLVVVAPVKHSDTSAWAFLRPFSVQLWAIAAAFFLLIGIVVWILEHRINDEFRGPPRKQFMTILWFSMSTLFFSHRENTVSTLGRLVLIIWLFVVLIINSSYTASLTSILTVQQLYSPIKGIESLREGDGRIGYQVGSFAYYYLTEGIGMDKSRLLPLGSPEEYAKALQLGPKQEGGVAAVVDELPYIQIFLSSHCNFRIIGQEFTKSGWGFAFPRDSPLASDLSSAILTLSENGDLQRISDKWLTQSSCSSDTTEIDSDRLHLKSFWGLYLLCGIACFIALVTYFVQIFHRFHHTDSSVDISGSSRSRRLLSIIDEKEDQYSKRKKLRRTLSESNVGVDLEKESKRRNLQMSSANSFNLRK